MRMPPDRYSAILKYSISPEIEVFSTLRNGAGISEGTYSSFNISPYCNDNKQNVKVNLSILSSILGIPKERIVLPHQTHGCQYKTITENFFEIDDVGRRKFLENTDALITALTGTCIGITTADCVPVLLFDKKKKVTAAIHAGWRGTANHIIRKTVDELLLSHNCNPRDILAVIGPSISMQAFEVGQEVYDTFKDREFDMLSVAKFMFNKWHIDLQRANKLELLKIGIPERNITDCGICTYENYLNFFSARRLSVNCGRIYSGIIIK